MHLASLALGRIKGTLKQHIFFKEYQKPTTLLTKNAEFKSHRITIYIIFFTFLCKCKNLTEIIRRKRIKELITNYWSNTKVKKNILHSDIGISS